MLNPKELDFFLTVQLGRYSNQYGVELIRHQKHGLKLLSTFNNRYNRHQYIQILAIFSNTAKMIRILNCKSMDDIYQIKVEDLVTLLTKDMAKIVIIDL